MMAEVLFCTRRARLVFHSAKWRHRWRRTAMGNNLTHQALQQLVVGIGELDGADAFVGGRDQHATERRRGNGETDYGGDKCPGDISRASSQAASGALVKAAAGAISGGIQGGRDVVSRLQALLDLAEAAGVHVCLGRNAQHGLKRPLEMKWAQTEMFGQQVQR